MCCEATDALLEYVRRNLGLNGLRNLNAPRRLKMRVPVLKEWLRCHGATELAMAIPDWDPVRRPTGRWKAWEMTYLKPIMEEKAIERQAKRMLIVEGAGGGNNEKLLLKMRNDAACNAEAAEAARTQDREAAAVTLSALFDAGQAVQQGAAPSALTATVAAVASVTAAGVPSAPGGLMLKVDPDADAGGISSTAKAIVCVEGHLEAVRDLLLRIAPKKNSQSEEDHNHCLSLLDKLGDAVLSPELSNCTMHPPTLRPVGIHPAAAATVAAAAPAPMEEDERPSAADSQRSAAIPFGGPSLEEAPNMDPSSSQGELHKQFQAAKRTAAMHSMCQGSHAVPPTHASVVVPGGGLAIGQVTAAGMADAEPYSDSQTLQDRDRLFSELAAQSSQDVADMALSQGMSQGSINFSQSQGSASDSQGSHRPESEATAARALATLPGTESKSAPNLQPLPPPLPQQPPPQQQTVGGKGVIRPANPASGSSASSSCEEPGSPVDQPTGGVMGVAVEPVDLRCEEDGPPSPLTLSQAGALMGVSQ